MSLYGEKESNDEVNSSFLKAKKVCIISSRKHSFLPRGTYIPLEITAQIRRSNVPVSEPLLTITSEKVKTYKRSMHFEGKR